MANTRRSPGVFITERVIPFTPSPQIGLTSMGVIGEAEFGPAFQLVEVGSMDEFVPLFGNLNPEKYRNTQIHKYELSYIADRFLRESDSLYVVRVLGLSGYRAGGAWSIRTIANPNMTTKATGTTTVFSGGTGFVFSTVNGVVTSPSPIMSQFATLVQDDSAFLTPFIEQFYSDIATDALNNQFTYSGTGVSSVVYNFGELLGTNLSTVQTFVTGATANNITDILGYNNNESLWTYNMFDRLSNGAYSGYSLTLFATNLGISGGTTSNITGRTNYILTRFTADQYAEYDNLIVATLRSSGDYIADELVYDLSANTLNYFVTGQYSGATKDPRGTFLITGTTTSNESFRYELSLNRNQPNFISKVLGTRPKEMNSFLFVEEDYSKTLEYLYNQGFIRGLDTNIIYVDKNNSNGLDNMNTEYKTPETPWLVSELRGTSVERLFKFVLISDGNNANTQIKISIEGIDLENKTFTVVVRDYFDTDANPIVLERFSNCSLIPNSTSYIASKIGDINGDYQRRSNYILVEMEVDHPKDAVPAGFEGYVVRNYLSGSTRPTISYKTKYDEIGDVINNVPFQGSQISNGDNVRRNYLGFSSTIGYDDSMFQYKGRQFSSSYNSGLEWNNTTKGFHMDSGATTAGSFEVGVGEFRTANGILNGPYSDLSSRKFTVMAAGGFDGWDIYRDSRTNLDNYRINRSGFISGNFANITTTKGNSDFYAFKDAIDLMSDSDLFSIDLFATATVDLINHGSLCEHAVDMVENRRDCMYLLNIPDIQLYNNNNPSDKSRWISSQEAADIYNDSGLDSSFIMNSFPYTQINDTVNNVRIYIPPIADLSRVIALSDKVSFNWWSFAGFKRGRFLIENTRQKISVADRNILIPGKINPISSFPEVGFVLFGNETGQRTNDLLGKVNIKRMLIYAQRLIKNVGYSLLFDPTDIDVASEFQRQVNPILDRIRVNRGLTDFRVKVSVSPEDIDNQRIVGKIFLKPTPALEEISLDFIVTPQQASFDI